MRLGCSRDAPERKNREELQDGGWPAELGSPPKTASPTVSRLATSSHDVLTGGSTRTANHSEGGKPHGPELLPWGVFLPVEENGGSWSGRRRSMQAGGDFNESLDEGKKRPEKVEKEGQLKLKEHAEAVGHVGGGALDDLLADLHEPSFSRHENERLRKGIATRLRAKVARLFGRVMCEYFSGSGPNRRSVEDGVAIATAAFRVKLKRLLDQSRLGAIQAQVTREISGITNVPTTRVRRECCMNAVNSQAIKEANERGSRGVLDTKLRSASTIARLHATAARLVAKPPRTTKDASTAIPVTGNMNASSRQEGIKCDPSPDTSGHIPQRVGAGVGVEVEDGGDSCPSPSCSIDDDAVELRRVSNGSTDAAAALGVLRSLEKGGSCDSRGGTSKGGSTDGIHSCSSEESVDKNDKTMGEVSEQTPTEWSSSDSDDDWLFTEEGAEPPLRPTGLCGEHMKHESRDGESLPHATAAEERSQTLLRREAPKRHFRNRGPRHNRRSSRRRSAAKAGAADKDSTNRDESWSNRSLTVLFKELGLHQSCQRAVLSKHMPASSKGGHEEGEMQPEPPPLPRIDRPHFRPTFVELAAAGKGSTLMMCPEPVAPGYEYSDVFEEVVKLHPPVGQLILEDIGRRNIVTRGDAIAHVESLERGSVANQAKLLAGEFLADAEVQNFLASAESLELDLAQCVAEGTLFSHDDVP